MSEQMRSAKIAIEKSVGKLIDKADDCFNRAKAGHALADDQHGIAETQHKNADKVDALADHLESLGQELVNDALELKGEIEIASVRATHTLPGGAEGTPLKAGSLTPRNSQ